MKKIIFYAIAVLTICHADLFSQNKEPDAMLFGTTNTASQLQQSKCIYSMSLDDCMI